jgi:hypothetical protein
VLGIHPGPAHCWVQMLVEERPLRSFSPEWKPEFPFGRKRPQRSRLVTLDLGPERTDTSAIVSLTT